MNVLLWTRQETLIFLSNDVPISTISRGIEIDVRQKIHDSENEIPKQFPEDNDVQM